MFSGLASRPPRGSLDQGALEPVTKALARIPEIEGVRGILSVLVVSLHIVGFWTMPCAWMIPWVWGCMEVFFCISGFLITRILIANAGTPGFLRKYFARRVLRIWPMYYFAMLFCFLVLWAGGLVGTGPWLDWHPTWQAMALELSFLQNIDRLWDQTQVLPYMPYFGHSWSVAIEEQFYFLWPFIFLAAVGSVSLEMAAFCCLAAVTFSTLLLLLRYDAWLGVCRLYGFALGALLAGIESRYSSRENRALLSKIFGRLWLWPLGALVPYLLQIVFGLEVLGSDTLIKKLLWFSGLDPFFNFALLGFCIVGAALYQSGGQVAGPLRKFVLSAPMQHLGAISYSTYLLHIPLLYGVVALLSTSYKLSYTATYFIGMSLSLGCAHLTYRFVELKAMNLKKYFAY